MLQLLSFRPFNSALLFSKISLLLYLATFSPILYLYLFLPFPLTI
uniref:Uncharacterized protein n=1 Tax=Rhizophora mucronata TaxID=61149 RepID=A0A2P2NX82_RHIMU